VRPKVGSFERCCRDIPRQTGTHTHTDRALNLDHEHNHKAACRSRIQTTVVVAAYTRGRTDQQQQPPFYGHYTGQPALAGISS